MTKYYIIDWPESQKYMDHPKAILITPTFSNAMALGYAVPVDIYHELNEKTDESETKVQESD
jgi:hypothetical protein